VGKSAFEETSLAGNKENALLNAGMLRGMEGFYWPE